MIFSDFMCLSDNEKSNCLWEKGQPVASKNVGEARFILYHVDGFYVEAEYKTDFNEVVSIKAFDINDLPEEYFSSIDIPAT